MIADMPEGNLRSTDRILKLERDKDNVSVKNAAGVTDNRMFTGEQTLHLKMDPETTLWSFQYGQKGLLPGALTGRFTSFSKGLEYAQLYFKKRNVKVTAQEE